MIWQDLKLNLSDREIKEMLLDVNRYGQVTREDFVKILKFSTWM